LQRALQNGKLEFSRRGFTVASQIGHFGPGGSDDERGIAAVIAHSAAAAKSNRALGSMEKDPQDLTRPRPAVNDGSQTDGDETLERGFPRERHVNELAGALTFARQERLELEAIARRFEGTLGICAAKLDDPNAFVEVGGDDVFPAASVIKIAVALEAFCQVEEGELSLAERVPLKATDKVIGTGVLGQLMPGIAPTIGDLVFMSMAISDNTAANLLIDRIGVFSINRRLSMLGLTMTRLSGKIFSDETKNGPPVDEDFGATASKTNDDRDDGRGERSPVTASELVRLLTAVHRRRSLPEGACSALLDILQKTQTASSIRRGLPEARFRDRAPARLYYKTGSIRGVVNDVGIVATERGAYAIALLSKGSKDLRPTQDNVARIALAEASRVIYRAMRGGE
jgi:beta-lactamase class A